MILQNSFNKVEAGCDEAGRGCLAGPVFAAAVILDPSFKNEEVKDSKMLNEKQRSHLAEFIQEHALAFSVAFVEPSKIDEINILNASILVMHLALDGLKIAPDCISVDGNRFKEYKNIPHQCFVKGDAKYKNIAAASILAKTYRDAYMVELDNEFPHYNWKKNKGYPTKEHRMGILNHGECVHHRQSFKLIAEGPLLELEL